MSKNIAKLLASLAKQEKQVADTKAEISAALSQHGFHVQSEIPAGRPFWEPEGGGTPLKRTAKAKASGTGKRGKRGEKQAAILKILDGKKMTTGEIKAAGIKSSNLSAELNGIKAKDLIDKDKDGKWFAVKK
jgi:hypothetical protein